MHQLPAPPNCPLRYPKCHPIEGIRPSKQVEPTGFVSRKPARTRTHADGWSRTRGHAFAHCATLNPTTFAPKLQRAAGKHTAALDFSPMHSVSAVNTRPRQYIKAASNCSSSVSTRHVLSNPWLCQLFRSVPPRLVSVVRLCAAHILRMLGSEPQAIL